jgi:hypothetical protein
VGRDANRGPSHNRSSQPPAASNSQGHFERGKYDDHHNVRRTTYRGGASYLPDTINFSTVIFMNTGFTHITFQKSKAILLHAMEAIRAEDGHGTPLENHCSNKWSSWHIKTQEKQLTTLDAVMVGKVMWIHAHVPPPMWQWAWPSSTFHLFHLPHYHISSLNISLCSCEYVCVTYQWNINFFRHICNPADCSRCTLKCMCFLKSPHY